ncbi:MAG: hypothetical protein J1F01_00800 [Oscillospiraceae bacterium]|nr:hypothetical protein [Oscillospiraceae bacterium]
MSNGYVFLSIGGTLLIIFIFRLIYVLVKTHRSVKKGTYTGHEVKPLSDTEYNHYLGDSVACEKTNSPISSRSYEVLMKDGLKVANGEDFRVNDKTIEGSNHHEV